MRCDRKRQRAFAVGAVACATALLSRGCANSPVLRSEPAMEDDVGLVYALPRGAVRIEAQRVDITPKLLGRQQ